MFEKKIDRWKTLRRATFIIFCIEHLVNGMIHTMFATSSWFYITRQLQTERPYLIYSVMTYLHFLPNLLFGLIITHFHDKFRQTRLFILFINVLCLIGGILYAIDISLYFPLVGCFILGIRFFVQPIAVGEMARTYPAEQLTYRLPALNICLFLGSGPACLINYLSRNIDFHIGPIHIKYGNFLGLVVVGTFLILQITTFLFAHNISLEFDLKSYTEEEKYLENKKLIDKEENEENKELNDNTKNPSILMKLKRILTKFDIMLMYFLVLLFNYIAYFCFSYVPLLLQAELHYSTRYVNFYYLVFTWLLIIFFLTIIVVKPSSKTTYFAGVISFIFLIIVGICFRGITENKGEVYNIAMLATIAVLNAIIYSFQDVFLLCTIAKFVKPDIQSLADGMRGIIGMIGVAAGCLCIPMFMEYKNIFYDLLLAILILSITLLIIRRKTLIDPKPSV